MSYHNRDDNRSDHKSRARRRSGEYDHRNQYQSSHNDKDERKRQRFSPPPPAPTPPYHEPKFLGRDEWDNPAPAYGAPPPEYMQAPPAPSYSNQVPFPTMGYDQYDTTGIYDNLMTPSQPPGLSDMLVPAPPQVQWNLLPQAQPKTNVEDQIKKEAAIAQEVKTQKATLVKQKEEYMRRLTNMKKELDTLKKQRDEMRATSRRDPSPETKHFLKENTKLQTEIENKLKTMSSVVDMLDSLIGEKKSSKSPERSSKSKKTRSSSSSDSSPERPTKKKSRSRSTSVTAEKRFNYVYYDPEMHWCRLCNDFPSTAKDYLNHLHTPLHHKNASLHLEAPWHTIPNLNEGLPNYPAAPTKRTPIKGLQFFVPSTAWYCKLCDQWIGDLHCASAHLKSIIHSKNFTNFVEQNPHWETDWMSDRQKALERQRGSGGKESTPAPPPPPAVPPAGPVLPTAGKKKRKSASPPTPPPHRSKKSKKEKKEKKSRVRHDSTSSSSSSQDSNNDANKKKKKSDGRKWIDKKLLTEDENDRKAIQALKEKMKIRAEKELLATIISQHDDKKKDREKRDKKEHRDMKENREKKENRERDERKTQDKQNIRGKRETQDTRDARDMRDNSKRDRDNRDANKDSHTPADSNNSDNALDRPKKNLVIERKMPFIGKMPVFKSLMKPLATTVEAKPAPTAQSVAEDKKRQLQEIQRKVLDFKNKLRVQNQQRAVAANGGLPLAGQIPPPPLVTIPVSASQPPPASNTPLLPVSFPQTIYSIAGGISNPVKVSPSDSEKTKKGGKSKNPLHQDFQEALDIIFPDEPKNASTESNKNICNQQISSQNKISQVNEKKKNPNNTPEPVTQGIGQKLGPHQQPMFQPQHMAGIAPLMGGPPGHMGGPPGHMGGPPGFMRGPPGHMAAHPGFMGGPPGFMGGPHGPTGDPGHMGGPPGFMGGPHGPMGGHLGHMGGPPMHMDGPPGMRMDGPYGPPGMHMDGPPGMHMDGPPGMHNMNFNFNQQGNQPMYPTGGLYEMMMPVSAEMPPEPAPLRKNAAMDELALLGIDAADVGAGGI